MAGRLAKGPLSLGMICRVYWDDLEKSYADELQLQAGLHKTAGMSTDQQEAVTAIRKKRQAQFTGG